MNVVIRNDFYSATISSLGAELKSLKDANTGREHMWQADPAWWKGSAPLLFPIVGGLRNGKYRHEGAEYELPQHGFARTSEFRQISALGDSAEFELSSSADTMTRYPFEFRLRAGFALERSGIAIRYEVANVGKGPMLFSIGSHPAFNLPIESGSLESHYILFERSENAERYFFKDGTYIAGKTAPIFDTSRVISLSRSLFDQGPIIIKAPQSSEFSIMCSKGRKSVKVATKGPPPFLALWSKPNAPFLCIEPWEGIPDSSEASGELRDKEGILSLEAGRTYETGYRIETIG
jgi:galactose mutarotase-like enzyme